MAWLDKYRREKDERSTPGKLTSAGTCPTDDTTETTSVPKPEFLGHPDADDLRRSRSKRGLGSEMDQCVDQENVPSSAQYLSSPEGDSMPSHLLASPVTPRSLHAHHRLNLALQRAAAVEQNYPPPPPPTHQMFSGSILQSPPSANFSPLKRRGIDPQSPLKSIRRTLGDITPTKNCRSADMTGDMDLPFNFGIHTSPANFSPDMALLKTPLPAEKYLPTSPSVQGSPMLKLKKRFQERFQEEKLIEKEELAKPIHWGADEGEEDYSWSTPVKYKTVSSTRTPTTSRIKLEPASLGSPGAKKELGFILPLSSPLRRDLTASISSSPISSSPSSSNRGETSSPRLLVATALVELGDTNREDIPLNLTKNK